MSSKVLEKKNGKSSVVYTKVSTYLSDKSKKALAKIAKATGKPMYEVMNEAIALYASSMTTKK